VSSSLDSDAQSIKENAIMRISYCRSHKVVNWPYFEMFLTILSSKTLMSFLYVLYNVRIKPFNKSEFDLTSINCDQTL